MVEEKQLTLWQGLREEKGREGEGTERRESGGTLRMSIDNQRQRGLRVEGHGKS